jgi:hypothetical protein
LTNHGRDRRAVWRDAGFIAGDVQPTLHLAELEQEGHRGRAMEVLKANAMDFATTDRRALSGAEHALAVPRRAGLSPEKVRPQEGDQRGTKPP